MICISLVQTEQIKLIIYDIIINMKKLLLILPILLIFSMTQAAPASPFLPGGDLEDIDEKISVTMSIPTPKPNQPFSISITSFSSNLNKSTIYWYVNNELESSGIGVIKHNFIAPGAGKVMRIGLRVETDGGNIIKKEYEVAPALVDLVYETNNYTPPFYKGKSIYTYQSTAIIHALPIIIEEGVRKNAKDLVYTWEVNGSAQQDSSGYGRNIFLYNGGVLSQPALITVTVESGTSGQVALGEILMEPADPEVLLIQEHPLYGLLNNSGGYIESNSRNIIVHAIPLFSSVPTREYSSLEYVWSLNGKLLGKENNNSIMAFQTNEGDEGTANLSVRIDNDVNFLQSASTAIQVIIQKVPELIHSAGEDFSL